MIVNPLTPQSTSSSHSKSKSPGSETSKSTGRKSLFGSRPQPPLHEAIAQRDLHELNKLIRAGGDVNQLDSRGRTPLHVAAEDGHDVSVYFLVHEKAKIAVQDNLGRTPLHEAVARNHIAVTERLLTSGGGISIKDSAGIMPFQLLPNDIDKQAAKIIEGKKGEEDITKTPTSIRKSISGQFQKTLKREGSYKNAFPQHIDLSTIKSPKGNGGLSGSSRGGGGISRSKSISEIHKKWTTRVSETISDLASARKRKTSQEATSSYQSSPLKSTRAIEEKSMLNRYASISENSLVSDIVQDGLIKGMRLRQIIEQGKIRHKPFLDVLYPETLIVYPLEGSNFPVLILKPLLFGEKGNKEVLIFNEIEYGDESDELIKKLKSLTPKYYGVVQLGIFLFIVLEDITHKHAVNTSVMELMITCNNNNNKENSSEDLIERVSDKENGIRVCSVFVRAQQQQQQVDQKGGTDIFLGMKYGKSLGNTELKSAFNRFLTPPNFPRKDDTLDNLIREISNFKQFLIDTESKYLLSEIILALLYNPQTNEGFISVYEFSDVAISENNVKNNNLLIEIEKLLEILNKMKEL
eukprot:c14398_g1_i1.p1 GENE.c14398_g1_i1~~c14398_g1_i1.p1  ORF type:complete len:579 (+),score=260.20 c14398_g1_i1:27-1763(+)